MNEREALLAELLDPEAPVVGWWPPAPGWWVLLMLSLGIAAGVLLARRRRGRRRREPGWQRTARAELATLRERLGSVEAGELLADASVLARRALLAVAPRHEIAALHGEAWLASLDAASGSSAFTRGPGRLLASGPFERCVSTGPDELAALLDELEALLDATARRNARA